VPPKAPPIWATAGTLTRTALAVNVRINEDTLFFILLVLSERFLQMAGSFVFAIIAVESASDVPPETLA
jgi:hypothetical protein